jgi:hypothetical protein
MKGKSGRYAIIPAWAVEDRRLGNAALRVICCIGTYADRDGRAYPSVRTIAARLGLSRSTVTGHLKELAHLGHLEIRRRARHDGGNAANEYRLLFGSAPLRGRTEGQATERESSPPQADAPALPLSAQPTIPVGPGPTTPVGPEPATIKNVPKERTHSRPTEIDPETAGQFETFWQAYPHRGPHDDPKKPALKLFAEAVRRGVKAATIIREAENYAAYVRRNRTDPRYIPQAKTWLSQERWTQHQVAPRSQPQAGMC